MDNNIQKARKIPMRQCLGCNAHRPKKELIRVVRTPEGAIVLDLVGKKSGRGAYICPEKPTLCAFDNTVRASYVIAVVFGIVLTFGGIFFALGGGF